MRSGQSCFTFVIFPRREAWENQACIPSNDSLFAIDATGQRETRFRLFLPFVCRQGNESPACK